MLEMPLLVKGIVCFFKLFQFCSRLGEMSQTEEGLDVGPVGQQTISCILCKKSSLSQKTLSLQFVFVFGQQTISYKKPSFSQVTLSPRLHFLHVHRK